MLPNDLLSSLGRRVFDPHLRDALGEMVKYRLLVSTLVMRELKARYRGSFLGFLWSFLNPLLLMLIYTLVFSVYLRMDSSAIGGPYAMFLFSGLLPWTWFLSSILEGSSSIIANGNLVNKALFPPEILPTVSVLSNFVHFLLGLPILALFLLAFGIVPTHHVVLLPVLMVIQGAFTLGVTLALATMNVYLRDLQHILGNVMTLWFFITPIIYPVSAIPAGFKVTTYLNPMAPLIAAYQDILFYRRWPQSPVALGVVALFAVVVAAWGYSVMIRSRDEFPEEV
ncbi:MAG: ABC transporter permease [Candidatus Schekmanbacteria bacterium]|nr:ABC transporter permease [Candidatus Schekmanbacteria bacterium]